MRDLCFSYYKTPFDPQGENHTAAWSEWLELFSIHTVRGKPTDSSSKELLDRAKMGPAILLGEVNGPRAKANVVRVNALSLDLDSCTDEQVLAVMAVLIPFESFTWTTHKHGADVVGGLPRLRIILPLAAPLAPTDHARAWAGLNMLVGGVNDPFTKDIGRLNFLPSTFDPAVAYTLHNDTGRWLSVADLPAADPADVMFANIENESEAEVIRRKIRRVRTAETENKTELTALAKGESFADEGARHQAVLSLTMWIAKKDTKLTQPAIDLLFKKSLVAMGDGAPTLDEVWTAYEGAASKLEEYRKEKAQSAQLQQAGMAQPYDNDDYRRIAKANGWEPEDLRARWALQRDGATWFLNENGEYEGPFGRDDLLMAVKKHLSRTPARLINMTKTGISNRAPSDVILENGSLIRKVVSDSTIQQTKFDVSTGILHEAVLPLRKLEPAFDSAFDGWLKLAGGRHYGKLVDWLACAPDLTKILCAIYFHGPKSSGKTLFGHGVAKLWVEGPPADIDAVLSDFNEELARCPIILADEQVPTKRHSQVTATLRSLLSTTSRTLKRKYRTPSELHGAVRLILAANNEFLLDSNDVSSSNDLEAIAERFLYIDIPDVATEFLANLPKKKREQLAQEGIARHSLWLMEHHEIANPGNRFYVEGDITTMHRLLMTGSHWNSLVCEWLTKYLLNSAPFDSMASGLIRRENGELLVNDQALVDNWDLYIKTKADPDTAKIGRALRAVSKTLKRKQLRFDGRQIRYRQIDINYLIAWADDFNIGDTQSILMAVKDPSVDSGKVVYTSPTYVDGRKIKQPKPGDW